MNLCPCVCVSVPVSQKLCLSPSPHPLCISPFPHCGFLSPPHMAGTLGHQDTGTLVGVWVPTYRNRVVIFYENLDHCDVIKNAILCILKLVTTSNILVKKWHLSNIFHALVPVPHCLICQRFSIFYLLYLLIFSFLNSFLIISKTHQRQQFIFSMNRIKTSWVSDGPSSAQTGTGTVGSSWIASN